MRTVIICRGMCWTRLARAMEGSNEGSEMKNTLWNDYLGTLHYDFIFCHEHVPDLGFFLKGHLKHVFIV